MNRSDMRTKWEKGGELLEEEEEQVGASSVTMGAWAWWRRRRDGRARGEAIQLLGPRGPLRLLGPGPQQRSRYWAGRAAWPARPSACVGFGRAGLFYDVRTARFGDGPGQICRQFARDPRGSRERDDNDEKSQRRFAADRALARFACGGWMAWLVALEIFDRRW